MTFILVVFCALSVSAQDTIIANPKAVQLRPIWTIEGPNPGGGDEVGSGVGSVGDINNDGIGDFAVYWRKLGQWRIYLGKSPAPDTTAAWVLDSLGSNPFHPVVGDFWGTDRKAVCFQGGRREYIDDFPYDFFGFHFFRTDDGYLPDTASVIINPRRTMEGTRIEPAEMLAADLDGDGADEFILVNLMVNRGEWDRHVEIWIYKGGPNFQVDAPTHIIRESQPNGIGGNVFCAIGDVDGDQLPDLLLTSNHPDGSKLSFWWGASGSPWNWNTPDRAFVLQERLLTPNFRLLDCDGDRVQDLLFASGTGPRIYRSNAGKNVRSRTFTVDDVDVALRRKDYSISFPLGPLNDSTGRYDMVGLASTVTNEMIAFSGSPTGPDLSYEASIRDAFGFMFSLQQPLMDVNGDGWRDVIVGNYAYFFQSGIAMVLGGGSYLPQDHTSGVRWISDKEGADAISVWPNPVRDELNISWQNDVKKMPRRFEVHDLLGRLVARGEVAPETRAALWQCATSPSGTYILSVFDGNQTLLASSPIVKMQ